MTFGRSVNVHTVPPLLGVHLVASIGSSASFWLLSKTRNSPVWASMFSPPASLTISGLIAVAGVCMASFSVPPLVGAALEALDDPPAAEDDAADVPTLLAPPQAARIAPISPVDMPITAPLRMNWRRSMRPATSSSM